ncbi:hypothetical protein [Corynebacterium heidelbergense]|uniref:Uncharacterized protein n=1 Tax=Corynebacterium heidelbergense TaxID=2055947 RepID=A0A364VC86_9CORY|nr:hypothetical protein [Corynebacterium heidelbergense]RAV34263.1 hypothetical protein CWC39_04220 [Corynebacterium heidelbergense]WCZ36965.1 hypothetical protein CHEID_07160 [Corynebacterium heidelbergense]
MWTPYTWEPVDRHGLPFRATFFLKEGARVEEMVAILGGKRFPFTLTEGGAELVIPPSEMSQIDDRSPAEIRVKVAGMWTVLCEGHLVRRVL